MLSLTQVGLVLNTIGSLLIALAFGKPPSSAYQQNEKGQKVSLAAFNHPLGFKIGITLLIFGFLISFLDFYI
jgi:hypothetical protein